MAGELLNIRTCFERSVEQPWRHCIDLGKVSNAERKTLCVCSEADQHVVDNEQGGDENQTGEDAIRNDILDTNKGKVSNVGTYERRYDTDASSISNSSYTLISPLCYEQS